MAKYRGESTYLGAWGYTFLSVLYVIPVVGLIALLIHSFSETNENRRHFARSYFTTLLFVIIVLVVTFTILYFVLGQEGFTRFTEAISTGWNNFIKAFQY